MPYPVHPVIADIRRIVKQYAELLRERLVHPEQIHVIELLQVIRPAVNIFISGTGTLAVPMTGAVSTDTTLRVGLTVSGASSFATPMLEN